MSQETKDQPIVDVEQAFSRTELYIEENKKSLLIIAGVIVALIGGYFAYKFWYVAGEEADARKELFRAEQYFGQDSLNLALNGNAAATGLTTVAEDYSATPSGNLAEYYIGISLLKQGKYEEAIGHLEEFESKDQVVSSIAIGAIGDCKMELGQVDEAITYYLKAAENNKNKFTTPVYLKKAAMAYEDRNNYQDAVKLYERIKSEYGETAEGRDMDKFIARAKTLGNI